MRPVTTRDALDTLLELSRALDEALEAVPEAVREFAEADRVYRRDHALAYMQASGTVDARQATADLATEEQRFRQRMAEGMRKHAYGLVEARRTQISAWQTLSTGVRAEMDLAGRHGT